MRPPPNSHQGGVLLMVVILITILSSIMAVSLISTNHYRKLSRINTESMRAYYAAQSALEKNYADLKTLINQSDDIEKNLSISFLTESITVDSTPSFLRQPGLKYVFSVNTVVPSDTDGNPLDAPVDSNPDPFVRDYYFLSATYVQDEGAWRKLNVQLEQPLKYSIRPLFYFGAFFDGDMEIHPADSMTISGRIHSNGTIYYGSSGNGALTFNGHVSAVNGIKNAYHPGRGTDSTPTTNNHTFAHAPFLTSGEKAVGTEKIDSSDSNPNDDGFRELIEMPVHVQNNEQFHDGFADQRLYNQAGLKIIVSPDGKTMDFYPKDGTQIKPGSGALYTYLTNTFKPEKVVPDQRIQASVQAVQVDVSNFVDSKNQSSLPFQITTQAKFPNTTQTKAMGIQNKTMITDTNLSGKELWNGIVYVATKDSTPQSPAGVLLMNGQILPDGGLSIVSPNNLYVIGDYNSGGSGSQVPSNQSVSTNGSMPVTTVNQYTRQPAALIADTVTVLSSKWLTHNQAQSNPVLRSALPTTINASIVSGYTAPPGARSGEGFENFVKLLENWSGTTLTLAGSFACLYESLEGKTSAGYVHPGEPLRQWIYDPNLQQGKLPPGTPYIVTLKRGQVKRVY